MDIKKVIKLSVLPLVFAGTQASAATLSYYLDQTNSSFLSSGAGANYAQVTISDGTDVTGPGVGDIDFLVVVNTSAFAIPDLTTFGMQSFGFNYDMSKSYLNSISVSNFADLAPDTWDISQSTGNGLGGFGPFGKFEFKLAGQGAGERTLELSFSIRNILGDNVGDYAIGRTASEDPYFAAHIAGYEILNESETSAMFGTVVPVPAAVWLFGSGLLGLVGIARRKKA